MKFPSLHWHRFERPTTEKINEMFSALVNHSLSTGSGFIDPGPGFSHWASVIQVKNKEYDDLQRIIDRRTSIPENIFDKKLAVKTIAPENRRNYVTADYYIPQNPVQASTFWTDTFYLSDPFNGFGGILFAYAGEYEFDGPIYLFNKKIHLIGEGEGCTRFVFRPITSQTGAGIVVGNPSTYVLNKGYPAYFDAYPIIIANLSIDTYTDSVAIEGEHIWLISCTIRQNPIGRIDYGSVSNLARAPIRLTGYTSAQAPNIIKDCTILCNAPVSGGTTYIDNVAIHIVLTITNIRIENTKIARLNKNCRFFLNGIYINPAGYAGNLHIKDCDIESYRETLMLQNATDATIVVNNCGLYTEYNAAAVARGLNI